MTRMMKIDSEGTVTGDSGGAPGPPGPSTVPGRWSSAAQRPLFRPGVWPLNVRVTGRLSPDNTSESESAGPRANSRNALIQQSRKARLRLTRVKVTSKHRCALKVKVSVTQASLRLRSRVYYPLEIGSS